MLTAILEVFNFISTFRKAKENFKYASATKKILLLIGVLVFASLALGAIYLALLLFKYTPQTGVLGVIILKILCWIGAIALCLSAFMILFKAIIYFMALVLGSLACLSGKDKLVKTSKGFNIFMIILTLLCLASYIVGTIFFVQYIFNF